MKVSSSRAVVRRDAQTVLEGAADGFKDRQRVSGRATAQRYAPPLGDTVCHLRVNASSVDINAVPLGRLNQIHRERLCRQLGIDIQKLRLGSEVAHVVVAAAAGHTAHSGIGAAYDAL